jgi:hypothetical protein
MRHSVSNELSTSEENKELSKGEKIKISLFTQKTARK